MYSMVGEICVRGRVDGDFCDGSATDRCNDAWSLAGCDTESPGLSGAVVVGFGCINGFGDSSGGWTTGTGGLGDSWASCIAGGSATFFSLWSAVDADVMRI